MSGPTGAQYLEKAERALEEARLLLQAGKPEGACSRAYYAMHDAALAALMANGHESSDTQIRTHRGLIAAFGRELVLGGKIDAEMGRAFNRAQDMRLLADYSGDPVSLSDSEWTVERAEAFLAAVRRMIERPEP